MKIMNKTKFFEKFGGLLVEASTDNYEYGNYLFLHPEEIDIVKQFDENTHQIVSVHETENEEDFVDMTTPCDFGTQPHKYGYFVIQRPFMNP
jgi:hypothetical protein